MSDSQDVLFDVSRRSDTVRWPIYMDAQASCVEINLHHVTRKARGTYAIWVSEEAIAEQCFVFSDLSVRFNIPCALKTSFARSRASAIRP